MYLYFDVRIFDLLFWRAGFKSKIIAVPSANYIPTNLRIKTKLWIVAPPTHCLFRAGMRES